MDPASIVGLVASILSIIALVTKLVQMSKIYIERARTPRYLRTIKDALESFTKALEGFKTALENLKNFAGRNPKSKAFALLHNSHGPFLGCGKALERTMNRLKPARGLRAIFRKPKWPISQEETFQLTRWIEKQTRVFQAAVKPDMTFLQRIAYETNLTLRSIQRGAENISRGIETGAHATELAIQQAGDILHISRDKKGIQESCQEVDGESNLSLVLQWLYPDKIEEKRQ